MNQNETPLNGVAERNPVKETRDKLGWSQEKLADELGCTLKTVWRCEQERRLPAQKAVLRNFYKMAKKAGVSVPDMAAA